MYVRGRTGGLRHPANRRTRWACFRGAGRPDWTTSGCRFYQAARGATAEL